VTTPTLSVDEASRCDVRYAVNAGGLLGTYNRAGVLTAADVHVASTLGRLVQETDERVLLAVALAVRAVREGSVCIDLAEVRGAAASDVDADAADLVWPAVEEWYAACSASPMVAVGVDGDPRRPVRLVDRLLYLDRYWRQEELVRTELNTRAARPPRTVDAEVLRSALVRLFDGDSPDYQRLAAAACALGSVTIVAGGPGTGKTTTIARVLAVLSAAWPHPPSVALAAPTGKAAARLSETLAAENTGPELRGLPAPGSLSASTLHRLLGWRPDSRTRFKHDRTNRLPHDVVVVDETSMVSLTMMSRLLEALRPDAALILVGDPDQLASVEAGAVLGDLVHRPAPAGADARLAAVRATVPDDVAPAADVEGELRNDVVRLRKVHRFGQSISALAEVIRRGDADRVVELLSAPGEHVEFLPDANVEQPGLAELVGVRADIEAAGQAMVNAARAGDAEAALRGLDRHRLLCGHRRGPFGVVRWSAQVERWLADVLDAYAQDGEWYVGRPLIVTANDYETGLFNGDTGVVVDFATDGVKAVFGRGSEPVLLPPNRLADVETVHAMTVHRAQGSEFDRISVILPPPESPLLTRELLYTAVTRARSFVRIIGSEAAVRAAVARPVRRASGLRTRR
jgi:exodeoxyribonuclease V alpha subunit